MTKQKVEKFALWTGVVLGAFSTVISIRSCSKSEETAARTVGLEASQYFNEAVDLLGFQPTSSDTVTLALERTEAAPLDDKARAQLERARRAIEKLAILQPDNPDIPMLRTYYYVRHGNLEAARREMIKAIGGSPSGAEAAALDTELAVMAANALSDNKLAEQLHRRAITEDPRDATIRAMYAAFLHSVGRNAPALEEFKAALSLDAHNAAIQNGYAHVLAESGQAEAAIGVLQQAIRAGMATPPIYNTLGVALELKGRHEEAIAAYKRARELLPPDVLRARMWNGIYLNNLAISLRALNRIEEANRAQEEAARFGIPDSGKGIDWTKPVGTL